jgi:hypothetical protein
MSILYDASLHNLLLSIKKLCKVLHKFFKWIKQHLKIKSFCGTTENAVRIQIFSALIAYCLVAIVGTELKIVRSTYEILQILGISFLDKTPVNELLAIIDYKDVKEPICKLLSINLF